jgi:UDP-N-acetylglucosamine 2-epimerase
MHFFKNMSPTDFLRLLYNCKCLIGNSSVGIRECSFLGVPVVNIGTRQSGRERGRNVIDVNHNFNEIQTAVSRQIENGRYDSDKLYGDGKSGDRIARLLVDAPLGIEKRLAY